jgi:hypothetical protein
MSNDTNSTELTDQELRDQFPEVVQGRAEKSKVLHIPDEEADQPEPICDRPSKNGWREVSMSCFPAGYHDFCDYCKRKLYQEDCGIGVGLTESAVTGQRWGEEYGDALTVDWGD